MNNFRKHCAFYIITFAHWCPQEGGKSRRSPSPETTILWGLFSPCEVPLFSFSGALCFPLEAIFSMSVCVWWGGGGGGGGGFLMWRIF